MREPPAHVRALGHPVVATPVFGMCAMCLYAWSQNAEAGFLGILALLVAALMSKACNWRRRYRDWQREWDSMAEPVARPAANWRPWVGGTVLLSLALFGAGSLEQPDYTAAIGGLILVGVLAALGALVRRGGFRRKSRSTSRQPVVALAVTRPLLPVPTLNDAYGALPAYCWQTIDATRT